MSAQVTEQRSNPSTLEEAKAFVKHVEALFMPWNVEGIVAGFTEDCVVRFGDLPEFRGRAELEKFFRARAARQNTIANTWEGEWEDSQTGAKMTGHGVEIWTMRGGRIS